MPSQYFHRGKFLASKGRERKAEQMIERKEREFNCPYASNPYHDCVEFCEKLSEKLQDEGKEPDLLYPAQEKGMKKVQRKGVTPTSIKALKSFSSCAGILFSINPASYHGRTKGMRVKTDKSDVHPYCEYASNPYHNCAKYCFHNVTNRDQPSQVAADYNPMEEMKTLVAAEGGVKLEIKNAPPSHTYDEYCLQSLSESHDLQAVTKSKEEKKIDLSGEILVNPDCQFASNPYHDCAEYCLQNAPERERHGHVKKLRSSKKIFSNKETSVHHRCKFASNPYHECGTECFQNKLDQNKANGASMKLKKETKLVVFGDGGVDPNCQFRSNPYHICAEYCIQNVPEWGKHGRAMKLNNLKKLKKAVSNIETTKVHPSFESNSYHACNAYFFQNEHDQNIIEGVFAMEKKRNSPSEKRSSVIMENSIVNLEFAEASNAESDYAEFSEGIAMEVVTNDLIQEIETKITREPSDVQPLQLDACDLFLEWAKYCSKENDVEDKIVLQVERRACETKNGQDHLKYYDSSNLERVKAEGSLQLYLSTSILFYLGFLFALFRWTQMLHSLFLQKGRRVVER